MAPVIPRLQVQALLVALLATRPPLALFLRRGKVTRGVLEGTCRFVHAECWLVHKASRTRAIEAGVCQAQVSIFALPS
jgi:hypothetical protein